MVKTSVAETSIIGATVTLWVASANAPRQLSQTQTDDLASAAFVTMWRERVDHFYARYSEGTASEPKH